MGMFALWCINWPQPARRKCVFEPRREKTCLRDFRHKPGCISAEDSRRLKFWSYEVEGLYYLCSENKGADQLRNYCAADLSLCFRICKKPIFS